MNRFLKFLFPARQYCTAESWMLLALRIVFGILLLTHGVAKWSNFSELSASFPDPLHIGSHLSLTLAIFGEVICSAGFIVGAFYRLALIPMIFTLCLAVFVIHAHDAFATKELAVVYLCVFVLLMLTGPGKFALDSLVVGKLNTRK